MNSDNCLKKQKTREKKKKKKKKPENLNVDPNRYLDNKWNTINSYQVYQILHLDKNKNKNKREKKKIIFC